MSKKVKRESVIRMPKKYDYIIHVTTLGLVLFGLIMITSASMGIASTTPALINVITKQIVFTVAGFIMMIFAARIFNFKWLRAMMPLLILGTFFLLFFALAFDPVGGARAWIRFPLGTTEVTIQPSEFAKIVGILIIAGFLGDLKIKKKTSWELIKVPVLLILSFVAIVALLQSDFGSGAVIFLIAVIAFLIPQHPQLTKWQKGIVFVGFVGMATLIFLMSPMGESFIDYLPLQHYQKLRILSAMNPFIDQYGSGYQLVNGLVSFASGGFLGVGFGNSIRKYTNFPAANTDFILAIIVEELGFFGFLIIFIGYGIIIWRLFKYAFKMKSEKGRIILVGTAMYLFIHFVLNVGGVVGLIPLTGIPLLLISYGGSSTMACMIAIGLSQAVISKFQKGEIE